MTAPRLVPTPEGERQTTVIDENHLGRMTLGDRRLEREVLELFLRHPGVVLTRSQILDAAWDFAYDGSSNVVDQYVTYLRRKIDTPFGRHDLETVRGMGYRLRHPDKE